MTDNPAFVLQSRPHTLCVDVPTHGATLLHPEHVILRFAHGQTIDVGVICYLKRESGVNFLGRRGARTPTRPVVLASFEQNRRADVLRVVSYVDDEILSGRNRSTTVAARLRSFLFFIEWADKNGYSNVLRDSRSATAAFGDFVTSERDRVRAGSLALNTAAVTQQQAMSFMSELLADDTFGRGLALLSIDSRLRQNTRPPGEDAQGKVLSLCEALFKGVTSFVLENRPYPHRLAMPSYLSWSAQGLWLFPTPRMYVAPPMAGESNYRRDFGYDYLNGRVRTKEELRARRRGPEQELEATIELATQGIAAGNSNPRYFYRLVLAGLAHDAFLLMFLAQTGMNLAQVCDLRWDGNLTVGAERQRFRAIKARAGDREVVFEIPAGFVQMFKRYLDLRQYLCFEERSELLFPRATPKILSNLYKRLRKFDSQLPRILSRQWRAAKSDWLIRNTDVSTAALLLQNSERTILKAYAAGSDSAHLEEMTSFLGKVSAAVVPAGEALEHATPCAVGSCTDSGHPVAIQPLIAPAPDCKKMEGCLFCEKFRVHADERDTRKLLSCRYCIEQTSHLFQSEERYQQALGPALDRVERLVSEIAERDAAMVARVTREVFEDGELDPYWASTMQMFMELGIMR